MIITEEIILLTEYLKGELQISKSEEEYWKTIGLIIEIEKKLGIENKEKFEKRKKYDKFFLEILDDYKIINLKELKEKKIPFIDFNNIMFNEIIKKDNRLKASVVWYIKGLILKDLKRSNESKVCFKNFLELKIDE